MNRIKEKMEGIIYNIIKRKVIVLPLFLHLLLLVPPQPHKILFYLVTPEQDLILKFDPFKINLLPLEILCHLITPEQFSILKFDPFQIKDTKLIKTAI